MLVLDLVNLCLLIDWFNSATVYRRNQLKYNNQTYHQLFEVYWWRLTRQNTYIHPSTLESRDVSIITMAWHVCLILHREAQKGSYHLFKNHNLYNWLPITSQIWSKINRLTQFLGRPVSAHAMQCVGSSQSFPIEKGEREEENKYQSSSPSMTTKI